MLINMSCNNQINISLPEQSWTSIFNDKPLILSSSKPAFDMSLNETNEMENEKSEPVTQSTLVEQCGKKGNLVQKGHFLFQQSHSSEYCLLLKKQVKYHCCILLTDKWLVLWETSSLQFYRLTTLYFKCQASSTLIKLRLIDACMSQPHLSFNHIDTHYTCKILK